MNKQELVAKLAKHHGVSLREAESCLEGVFAVVEEALLAGEVVKVPGFGVFSVKERASRQGIVPGTSERIEIPAKRVVTFKPSKTLKERL